MSVLPEELTEEVFNAIAKLREVMPEIEALSALVPGYGPAIVEGEKFLSKIFEIVCMLRDHDTRVDAAEALRKKTEEDWAQALRG